MREEKRRKEGRDRGEERDGTRKENKGIRERRERGKN